jgi:hypothetical protein
VAWCKVDSYDSGSEPATGCCEKCYQLSGSKTGDEFYCLNYCSLVTKDSAAHYPMKGVKTGASNLRPAGQMRSVNHFHPALGINQEVVLYF